MNAAATRDNTARSSARSQVRVLLVEDHVLFAESMELALFVEGYDVRRLAAPDLSMSPQALLTAILKIRPRIVLLDLDLGDFGDGVRLVRPLAEAGIDVVVVSASQDEARRGDALRRGARKVLSKSGPLTEVMATVRRLHQGLPVMDVVERERIISQWYTDHQETADARERLDQLTPRERQVLGHLMQGRAVGDIAVIGVVSEATVRTQVKSILAKLDVSSQLAAVGLAHRVQWRPPQV